jgi:hypothetical protein
MARPTRAPTAAELRDHPVVRAALEEAWMDSLVGDPDRRHEEGGWIYLNTTTGEITIRRAPAGEQAEVNLEDPPILAGSVIVGIFHTHPNPSSEGWNPGPSEEDRRSDERDGVPDLIHAEQWYPLFGPSFSTRGFSRCAGFS